MKFKEFVENTTQVTESAEYAKQLVRGEKYGPGLLNKLDQWFMDSMVMKSKNRFVPADVAKKQLKLAGFSDEQIGLIRDVAVEAGYAALERIKTKYPKEVVVPKYFAPNKTSFQVADLYLNVGEDIHEEFAALFQKLFDQKIKKIAEKLKLTEETLTEASAWFKNGAKVKLVPEYADKDPDEIFTLSSVDVEGQHARIADKNGSGWKIRMSQVMPAKKTVRESTELQSLGKALKGGESAEPTEEDPKTAVNTPPVEKTDGEVVDSTEVEKIEFKVGDIVKPLKGPHKGEPHSIIHVFPDGAMNIKPVDLEPDAVKYRLGAAKAQPDEVQLAESKKVLGMFKKGSLLAQIEVDLMEAKKPKSLADLKKRAAEVSDEMDRIIQDGGRIPANDPLSIEHRALRLQIRKMKREAGLAEGRDDNMMPLSYGPKAGHTIEAYGRKGMKNTMWRKMFKNQAALEKWLDDNDATLEGSRELDDNEKR